MGKHSDKETDKKTDKKTKKKDKEKKSKSDKPGKKAQRKSAAERVTPTQRIEMIATAAYYIAERHGFQPERADEDWREAELEIDKALGLDR
jgi:hypothetical protein